MSKARCVVVGLAACVLLGCSPRGLLKNSNVPKFVLNPPNVAGCIFGIGMAEQASPQLAIEIADLRARQDVAKVLSQKTTILLKNYLGQTDVNKQAEKTEYVQSVSRALVEQNLQGCVIEKREIMDGKVYSLARFPFDSLNIMNKIERQVATSRLRAKEAFQDLDTAIEKSYQAQMQQEKLDAEKLNQVTQQ